MSCYNTEKIAKINNLQHSLILHTNLILQTIDKAIFLSQDWLLSGQNRPINKMQPLVFGENALTGDKVASAITSWTT